MTQAEWIAMAPVLSVTFIGTVGNNIVNVPMTDIIDEFGVSVSQGALVVIAWGLAIAVFMPLMGWLGDRIGRRRLFVWAVLTLAISCFGAALSPNLALLVAFRTLQGAASAAVLPTVMGLVGDITPNRARGLSAWAMANSLGQAVGAPLGGWFADLFGWRAVFWPLGTLCLLALVVTLKVVPSFPGRAVPLEWRGALAVTSGAGLLLAAVAVLPQLGPASPVVWGLASAGVLFIGLFLAAIRRAEAPFVPTRLLVDKLFVRCSLGVFAQMFCLGATMLAVPLYLTQRVGMSTGYAGILVFALPAAMTVLAPLSGSVTQRLRPLPTMRCGLLLLTVAQCLMVTVVALGDAEDAVLAATMVLVGTGVAFVQTPAATLASGAVGAASAVGAGLGLYNLVRFSGAMFGASGVAVILERHGAYEPIFAACAAVAALGLLATFARRVPARTRVPRDAGAEVSASVTPCP